MPRGVNTYDTQRLQGRNQADANALNVVGPGIITGGLVLHLDAGNRVSYPTSGTTWYDLTAGGRNGTLTLGPTFSLDGGGSIVYDGINDYVQVSGSFVFTETTWICWIKRSGNQVSYAGYMFSRGTNVTGLGFRSTTNKIHYHWNDSVDSQNFDSGLLIPDNTWTMTAMVVDSAKAVVYVNLSSATNTASHTSTTIDDLKLGQDEQSGSRDFTGSMGSVMIYDRALSPDEIAVNYFALRNRYGV